MKHTGTLGSILRPSLVAAALTTCLTWGCGGELGSPDSTSELQTSAQGSPQLAEMSPLVVVDPLLPAATANREFVSTELVQSPPVPDPIVGSPPNERVFGTDDRARVNPATAWPYSTICKLTSDLLISGDFAMTVM